MPRLLRVFALHVLTPALVAACVSALGHAYTARADTPSTMIYACVNNNSGTIHVISATGTCANNEIRLSWSSGGSAGGGLDATIRKSLTHWVYIIGDPYTDAREAISWCQPGERVTRGGYDGLVPVFDPETGVLTSHNSIPSVYSAPISDPATGVQGWTVVAGSSYGYYSASGWDVPVYAVCAAP